MKATKGAKRTPNEAVVVVFKPRQRSPDGEEPTKPQEAING